jgi:tetratricopeptide (TPR) repeat protein
LKEDIYHKLLSLARGIPDPYVRAVTYARIGYQMKKKNHPKYKEPFAMALNAIVSIDNPVLMIDALLEVGTLLGKANPEPSRKIFTRAYELILELPPQIKDELLGNLVSKLLELENVNDALFYATSIKDPVKRNDLLTRILSKYLEKNNLRKAHVVLESIDMEPWKSIALFEILKAHLAREEFGTVIGLLPKFRSEYWLGEAMKALAGHLKRAEVPEATYEKFLDIALELMPKVGEDALRSFLIGMALQGEMDFVIRALSGLSPELKQHALTGVVSAVLDRPEILDKLIESLPNEDFEFVAGLILDSLLNSPPRKEYAEIVKKIGLRTSEERYKVKAVRYLSKLRAHDAAWEIASSIRDSYFRSLAFGSIAVEKLKENDIGGAIDATLEVRDPLWGPWLLGEVIAKIAEVSSGEELREDIEERAERQQHLWAES